MKLQQILEARTLRDDRPEWILDRGTVETFFGKWGSEMRDELWHLWMMIRDYENPDEDDLESFIEDIRDDRRLEPVWNKIPHESLKGEAQEVFDKTLERFHIEAYEELHQMEDGGDEW